jgi:hypothetical protein
MKTLDNYESTTTASRIPALLHELPVRDHVYGLTVWHHSRASALVFAVLLLHFDYPPFLAHSLLDLEVVENREQDRAHIKI